MLILRQFEPCFGKRLDSKKPYGFIGLFYQTADNCLQIAAWTNLFVKSMSKAFGTRW